MARVSFGIGGFKGGMDRKFIAEVESQPDKIAKLTLALQDLGFWTVVSEAIFDRPTSITIGEVFTQKEAGNESCNSPSS